MPTFQHVFVLPALGVPAAVYAPLLQALGALPDTRGELLPLPSARGGWRAAWAARQLGYLDWLQTIELQVAQCRRAEPGSRMLLLGHSIGGHAALLVLARQAVAIDGVMLVASGTPHWRAWPTAEQPRMRRGLRAVAASLRLCPWYPGDWLGFGGRQPHRLMRDWLTLAQSGRFDGMAGLAGVDARLQRAQGEVLAVGIEGDGFAPPAATKQLLDLAPQLSLQTALASSERLRRESPARRHNLWPRDPQAVLPHLLPWLQALLPKQGPLG